MADVKTTLRFASFIVFIDMAGIGLVTPVMPRLIQGLSNVDIGRAAEIGGYLFLAYATMQFLFSPIIGSLSDRFGRRPVLLFTLASLAIDYGVMSAASSLWLIVAGRMISGVMGATWAAANSCVADTVPEKDRGSAFGMIGGAGAAGLVLGPAIGGLAGEYGARLPFMVAAAFAAIGTVIGYWRFEETLSLEARRPFDLKRANPVGSLVQATRVPFIFKGLVVLFVIQFALQAQMAVWPYYGTVSFGWTPLVTGLTTSLYGVLMIVVRAFLTKRTVERLGPAATARIAILFAIPSYLLIAFAGSTWVVIIAIFVGSIGGMTFPAVQTMMSTQVAADAQGELQGLIASSMALTTILGPVIMTQLFEHFVNRQGVYLPGAPFLASAGLLAFAAALLWRLTGSSTERSIEDVICSDQRAS